MGVGMGVWVWVWVLWFLYLLLLFFASSFLLLFLLLLLNNCNKIIKVIRLSNFKINDYQIIFFLTSFSMPLRLLENVTLTQ